jgi:RNA polymerase sigma-70 factor (ECF subfamily)
VFSLLVMMVSRGEGSADEAGDEALVAAAQRGDAQAFAALHKRYYTRIYRLAYLKTNHVTEAEDVAGETFLRALAHLPQFRFQSLPSGQRSLYPWLHRIAVNLIADQGRKHMACATLLLDVETAQRLRLLLGNAHEEDSPCEIAERHEVQQMVRDAIAGLPEDYGEVLVYRYLGDLSLREIARLVGRSEPATKSLLHRAVVLLREELSRKMDSVGLQEIAQAYHGKDQLDERSVITAGRRSDT